MNTIHALHHTVNEIEPRAFADALAGEPDSPLIWLASMPHALETSLRKIAGLFEFYAADDAWGMLDRRDESLWVVGGGRGIRQLVESQPAAQVWLDQRMLAADELGEWLDDRPVCEQAHHLRRAAGDRARVRETGPVRIPHRDALRRLDAEQYGRALDAVVDYETLLGSAEVFGAWDGDSLVASALVARPHPSVVTVSSLWTLRSRRRERHAHRLMHGILGRIAPSECALNVSTSNLAALRLYQSLDFRRAGGIAAVG